jgi:hypothetical protein
MGWTNITNFSLVPKKLPKIVCEHSLTGTRSSISRAQLWKQMISSDLCEWLASEVNIDLNLSSSTPVTQKGLLDSEDILQICGTLLLATISPTISWKSFVHDTTRQGISRRKLEKFMEHLKYAPDKLFQLVNKSFKSLIKLGGIGALDETIWGWKGNHAGVIFIERKPKGEGFKVLTFCTKFTRSGRSFCYHFIPDIQANLSVYQVLDQFGTVIPKGMTIAADNWFGMLNWLQFHANLDWTLAVKETQQEQLWKIFGHDLHFGEYRSFFNGKMVLTVFADNSIVKTASTHFNVENVDPSVQHSNQLLSTNIVPPPFQLSEDAAKILATLPHEDLKKLAAHIGKSTGIIDLVVKFRDISIGGTNMEIAYNISGCSLPPSTSVNQLSSISFKKRGNKKSSDQI